MHCVREKISSPNAFFFLLDGDFQAGGTFVILREHKDAGRSTVYPGDQVENKKGF